MKTQALAVMLRKKEAIWKVNFHTEWFLDFQGVHRAKLELAFP